MGIGTRSCKKLSISIRSVFRGEGEPCSLVIWVKIMGRKCKAVVDSGAQVTVINKDCFKEYMGCCRR